MSRSNQALNRPPAAFDFDVVTDVPPPPLRKPEAAPETARARAPRAEAGAKTAEP